MIDIIAEIGINHNGSALIAYELIEVAREAGCNYVKFQKRTPSICVPELQKNKRKMTPWGEMSYLEYKEHIEFCIDKYRFIDCCELPWFASVWDIPSVDFMECNFPETPYYKIPSALLTDCELLLRASETGHAVILSTGMSTMHEIEIALNMLIAAPSVTLMHSVSCYPLEDENANLEAIETLKTFGYPVGYSDHTKGIHMSCAAAAMGVTMIEKHITLDRTMWGTDQSASLEPALLQHLVRNVRSIELGMGDGLKNEVQECEQEALERLRP